jgi:hypothetical protein
MNETISRIRGKVGNAHPTLAILAIMALVVPAMAANVDLSPLRPLAVLDHGRIKPIDTVARETARVVTGSEYFGPIKVNEDGQQEITGKLDPLALMLDWAAHPVQWQTQPVLYVPLIDLRTKLGMKEVQKWVSPRAVMENTDFALWVRGVEEKRATAEQNHEKVFLHRSHRAAARRRGGGTGSAAQTV